MVIIAKTTDPITYFARLKPLKTITREVSSGLSFSQESVYLDQGRLTNLYWLEMDKNKYKFKLSSNATPRPLKDYEMLGKKLVAGINFGSFFLSDDLQKTDVPFYNLVINNGNVWQFSSNNRPALLTNNGNLSQIFVLARGGLKIGNHLFSWSGSLEPSDADLIAFGMFDITVVKTIFKHQKSKREIVEETKFVECEPNQLLLGFVIDNGRAKISKISNFPLDLTKFAFVLKGESTKLGDLKEGDVIESIEINQYQFGKNDDVCSASFSLGNTKGELIENLRNQLVYPVGSQPKPISGDYRKSWSVVLQTRGGVVFFINDARPKIDEQSGITVFELQKILSERFNYPWACVGDSGQSSKLRLINGNKSEIYGNMHYQNYGGKVPAWDGENGRLIPVALLVYE